jgi:hypothetical protein
MIELTFSEARCQNVLSHRIFLKGILEDIPKKKQKTTIPSKNEKNLKKK